LHVEALGDGGEGQLEVVQIQRKAGQIPFHPHQEQLEFSVLVLVGVQDIGVVLVEKIGNGGHQTFLVGATDEQDGGVLGCHDGLENRLATQATDKNRAFLWLRWWVIGRGLFLHHSESVT
jgi:hypothetical protein